MRGCDNVYQQNIKKLWLSVHVVDFKMVGVKEDIGPTWNALMKPVDLDSPTALQNTSYLGCKPEPEVPEISTAASSSTGMLRTLLTQQEEARILMRLPCANGGLRVIPLAS